MANTNMTLDKRGNVFYFGILSICKLRKSQRSWLELWAVVSIDALRLYSTNESYSNGAKENKQIPFTAETFCYIVENRPRFQFKLKNNNETFLFKCNSKSSRQQWLDCLDEIFATYRRNNFFQCEKDCERGRSLKNCEREKNGGMIEHLQSTSAGNFVNTRSSDRISLLNSPKETNDINQLLLTKSRTFHNESPEGNTVVVTGFQSVSSMEQDKAEQEKPPENFDCALETVSATDITQKSSSMLFKTESKTFSTFGKKSSQKCNRPLSQFVNPTFSLDEEDFSLSFEELTQIQTEVSKSKVAPLDYDVPSLSKANPGCNYLKVRTDKKKWKKFYATCEKNILFLRESESSDPKLDSVIQIEMKPKMKITQLPRRGHDHRFKMTTGSTEYFFKTASPSNRDLWMKTLTEARYSLLQNASPRNDEKKQSEIYDESIDQSEDDDVFYDGLTTDEGGLVSKNVSSPNIANAFVSSPEELPKFDTIINETDGRKQANGPMVMGYIKTNAIDNNWDQYWAEVEEKQLILHSSENNRDYLKTILLSQNARCKMAKRSLHDFRFTLTTNATEFYDFKCTSAYDRREWINGLNRTTGDFQKTSSIGSRIPQTISKIRESKTKLKKTQREQQQQKQQRNEKLGDVVQIEKVNREILSSETETLSLHQQQAYKDSNAYEMISAGANTSEIQIPSSQKQEQHNKTLKQQEEKKRENEDKGEQLQEHVPELMNVSGEIKDNIYVHMGQQESDVYELMNPRKSKQISGSSSTRSSLTCTTDGGDGEISEFHKDLESSWNFEDNIKSLDYSAHLPVLKTCEGRSEIESNVKNHTSLSSNRDSANKVILQLTQDVERFLTQVLGKLSNLPADVNRQRLDLVQRLQRHLNKPGIGFKKKLPVPIPEQASNEVDGEDDVGEYGDVAVPQTPQTKIEEEMYDDVATQEKELPEENYDDVVAIKKQVEEKAESQTSEEFYDDVNGTQNKSLSSKSNNSDSLDAKEIGEPIKASDIIDKIFEGELDKYKGKRPFKKWQRRYCVLTSKALYYYENKKDQKQKGQIMLPCGETILRPGCHSYSEVKDKKTCFELVTDERCYLFKAIKESEYDAWTNHLTSVLHADLSEEQSKLMRLFSVGRRDDDDDDAEGGEDLYECIDQMQQKRLANPSETEDMYELTDQFSSQVSESSASSGDAPTLPSRVQAPLEKQTCEEEEEFDEIDEKETSDAFPTLPPRPTPSQSTPLLPTRKSSPGSQEAPELPHRAPSKTAKPPAELPPPPPKKPSNLSTQSSVSTRPPALPKKPETKVAKAEEPASKPPVMKPPVMKPPVMKPPVMKPPVMKPPVMKPPAIKKPLLKGEIFEYSRVYVAMWNCIADDEDDLAFSRGNYLYIREKIPNSDWWVASLMDIPDIRVGLVPRNYIMPAYDM